MYIGSVVVDFNVFNCFIFFLHNRKQAFRWSSIQFNICFFGWNRNQNQYAQLTSKDVWFNFNLEFWIHHTCMSLDGRCKLENPEKSLTAKESWYQLISTDTNFTNSEICLCFLRERTPLDGRGEAEEAGAVIERQAGVEHVPRLHSRHAHQRRHAPHLAVTDLRRLGETWGSERWRSQPR